MAHNWLEIIIKSFEKIPVDFNKIYNSFELSLILIK